MKRIVASVLLLSLASPALADTLPQNLKRSVASVKFSADQARPNATSGNEESPYYWPSIILMGAGGLVTLWGLTHETGVECSSTSRSLSCGTTKSKATIFTGLGMVGVGAVLFGKSKSHPDLMFGPRAVGVQQKFSW